MARAAARSSRSIGCAKRTRRAVEKFQAAKPLRTLHNFAADFS
jgi:hypothetical protein